MSFYLKIGSILVIIFASFKLRQYLKKKLTSNQKNDSTLDQQIVLFFPETQIKIRECYQHNYAFLMTAYPSAVLCQLLFALKSSRDSVDICLFSLSFEPIIQLIKDLSESGIYIRIVINGQKKTESPTSEEPQQMALQNDYLKQLFKFGVELKFICLSDDGLMHNKFAIIDNKILINGSLNWTESCIFSYNDCIITTDPKLVLTYLRHFNDFWTQTSF